MSTHDTSPYHHPGWVRSGIAAGHHREMVGGLWEEIGQLQVDFLREQGLQPGHYLLDIGCGCFRGGVRFVEYLKTGHYYGIDLNAELIKVGYACEIAPRGLHLKLPAENQRATANFDVVFDTVRFDYAIAFSLFTHIPLSQLHKCLMALMPALAESGMLLATYFELPENAQPNAAFTHESGITTHPSQDPYHVSQSQLRALALACGWQFDPITDFTHPRAQKMGKFTLLPKNTKLD